MNFLGFKVGLNQVLVAVLAILIFVLLLLIIDFYHHPIFVSVVGSNVFGLKSSLGLVFFLGLICLLLVSLVIYNKTLIKENHRKILNTSLILVLVLIEVFIVHLIYTITPKDFSFYDDVKGIIRTSAFQFIPIVLILGWTGLLIGYYAWSIYFYSINFGFTNDEWQRMRLRVSDAQMRKSLGEVVAEADLQLPNSNPYKEETFGLPPGTVRGTIALSLVVGGFALLIFSMNPLNKDDSEQYVKLFEFFTQAYIMMIAFYFGSSSLKYFSDKLNVSQAASNSKEERTSEDKAGNKIVPIEIEELNDKDVEEEVDIAIQKRTDYQEEDEDLPVAMVNPLSKGLSANDIQLAAEKLEVEVAAIKAVIAIESLGKGFYQDGRPVILFEGHIFYSLLKQKGKDVIALAKRFPTIIYPNWVRTFYKKGAEEYTRLDLAQTIDQELALKSASYGLFQIMGFNHHVCGYDTVQSFVADMKQSEGKQLAAFMNFIKNRKTQGNDTLASLLQQKNWARFAFFYNGPGYKKNNYDVKLEEAYVKYDREANPALSILVERKEYLEKETLGELSVIRSEKPIFTCKTLELPDLNNQKRISCIPKGEYWVSKRTTDSLKDHFYIENVPNRSWILIHAGNKYTEILGCILVGDQFADIDKDGVRDVINSRKTLAKLNEILPKRFKLSIK